MADRLDVAARLTEGRPAVEHTQTYVQACHLLGYQDPDLTAHAAQVRDWYETETGLDLRVLDDDSAELRVAVNTIDEALWLQHAQLTEIVAAWTGPGADSATRFLERHCDRAAEVVAQVRAAAEGYAALRDNLWRLVDGKAATAVAIDDRRLGERSTWLAAAQTATAGAGDRSAAEELVRQHVIPYVDNDIRVDWLDAMRSTAASVGASYDAAIETLSSAREVCFEIPGELGLHWQPEFDKPPDPGPVTATTPATLTPPDTAPTVPAAASAPPPPPTRPLDSLYDWPTVPPDLTDPLGDTAGLSTGAGNLGGLAGISGGIGALVGKIVHGIGGLVGSLADGLSDPSGSGDPLLDDPLDDDDPIGEDANATDDDDPLGEDASATDGDHADDADAGDAQPTASDEEATEETPAENPPAAADSVDEPVAQPVTPPDTPPSDAPPQAPPEPQPGESTPCEIAADELPKAGQ